MVQMLDSFVERTIMDKMIADLTEKLPVKHVAYPDEVADAYLFLMKYAT